MSPHPRAGLNFESIGWCDKLIEKYPDIKINLFVPAAYCRLGEQPCYLSKNPEWVKKVNNLSDNYRINMHGMFHRRVDGKNSKSNNDEFQFLNAQNAKNMIDKMTKEFKKAGLKFNRTFRAPGWKLSSGAIVSLIRSKFVIAGSKEYYDKYIKQFPVLKDKYISYNWDLISKAPNEDIFVAAHTSIWTNNYFNEEMFNVVKNELERDEFKFVFIEDEF